MKMVYVVFPEEIELAIAKGVAQGPEKLEDLEQIITGAIIITIESMKTKPLNCVICNVELHAASAYVVDIVDNVAGTYVICKEHAKMGGEKLATEYGKRTWHSDKPKGSA